MICQDYSKIMNDIVDKFAKGEIDIKPGDKLAGLEIINVSYFTIIFKTLDKYYVSIQVPWLDSMGNLTYAGRMLNKSTFIERN